MRLSKMMILASLFFSVNSFSLEQNIWQDSRNLHNSAWHVVQLIESKVKLSHLTMAARDFTSKAGKLKYSIRINASGEKIRKDFTNMEHAFAYLTSRLSSVRHTRQYKAINRQLWKMQSRFYLLRDDIATRYNYKRIDKQAYNRVYKPVPEHTVRSHGYDFRDTYYPQLEASR